MTADRDALLWESLIRIETMAANRDQVEIRDEARAAIAVVSAALEEAAARAALEAVRSERPGAGEE